MHKHTYKRTHTSVQPLSPTHNHTQTHTHTRVYPPTQTRSPVSPIITPLALSSQWGASRPEKAGTKYTPPVSGTCTTR